MGANVSEITVRNDVPGLDVESSWLVVRIFVKFANAIMEQSESSESPSQRSSSMISYCVSPFAAMCMTTAIFLNRIVVFASSSSISRNRTKLPIISHIVLRFVALYLLFSGSYGVLVAFKLKLDEGNSPIVRYLLSSSYFDYDFVAFKEMNFLGLPYLSKSFLDFNHSSASAEQLLKSPSPSILKPAYLSLCLAQILETFIAATNGNDPLVENGLTLFEYSLAFQEVQSAAIPSYELLVISLVAIINQALIHLLGLLNLRNIRLIPSSMVGSFVLSFYFFSVLNGRILNFPYIVVMGYLPQLLTFFIIVLCVSIFLLAAIFKGSYRDLEFSKITDNLNSINIIMTDDFFTALTNLGSFMITAAGKASYVKEISEINIARRTWLENSQKQRSKSFISKITGYNNALDVPPDLQELRERSASQRSASNSKWIVLGRIENLKRALFNLKDVLVSFFITNKTPRFLKHESDPTIIGMRARPGEAFEVFTDSDEDDDEDYIAQDDDNDDNDTSEDDNEEDTDIETDASAMDAGTETSQRSSSSEAQIDILQELIASPEDLLALVTTDRNVNASQLQLDTPPLDLRILKAHLLKQDHKIVTRSRFNSSVAEPSNKLLDLILEKRLAKHENHLHDSDSDSDSNDDANDTLPDCVICQTNQREIILWPCKCLAICESCRVSLIVRGFNDCVCCRRKVEAYSKVFVP